MTFHVDRVHKEGFTNQEEGLFVQLIHSSKTRKEAQSSLRSGRVQNLP